MTTNVVLANKIKRVTSKPMQSLSVIIPAYNEASRISSTLQTLYPQLAKLGIEYEIIVVNDGSTDNTAGTVLSLNIDHLKIIENEHNRGKGHSCYVGMSAATCASIIIMDADGSTDMEAIERFLKIHDSEGCDVIIGSRALSKSVLPVKQGILRRIMGFCFRLLVKIFFLFPWKDTQCGFKFLTKKSAQKILPLCNESGFAFDIEMLFWLRRFKFLVKEVEVIWRNNNDSRVPTISGPVKMFYSVVRFRIKTLFIQSV